MDIIKTDGDIKRDRDVVSYINKMTEYDTSVKTMKYILLKFPDLKGFTYVRSEELHKGSLLRTVDLNIQKLSVPAIIVDIKKGSSDAIINITLYNNGLDSYWKILPSKYYLFILEPSENKHVKRLISEYIEMGFKIK